MLLCLWCLFVKGEKIKSTSITTTYLYSSMSTCWTHLGGNLPYFQSTGQQYWLFNNCPSLLISTLEAFIQKCEDHPVGSRNKPSSLIFITGGGKNAHSSGRSIYIPLQPQQKMLEPQACSECSTLAWLLSRTCQKSAETADRWERYTKSIILCVIYALFLYKVKSPQGNLPGPH